MHGTPHHAAFESLAGDVVFHDGSESLLDPLASILRGWHHQPAACAQHAHVRVHREGDEFVIDTPWLEHPVRDHSTLRAAGNLAVDLVEAWLAEHPDTLSLHCGAALFGNQLVVFPARSHAGKSTLMARLAADNIPVFTDDVLPLSADDTAGLSLGLQPRLRLPLPDSAGPALRRLAAEAPLQDERYAYVRPADAAAPVFGRWASIGAIVLLERMEPGFSPARLETADRGDGLQELIFQNLSPDMRLPQCVARLHQLIARLPCFRLLYADLEEAAVLLGHRFPLDEGQSATAEPPVTAQATPLTPPTAGFRPAPGVTACAVDAEVFVVGADGNRVFRLNPLASGIWKLLAETGAMEDIVDVIAAAFPEQGRERIKADVASLLTELVTRGLVLPPDEARAA